MLKPICEKTESHEINKYSDFSKRKRKRKTLTQQYNIPLFKSMRFSLTDIRQLPVFCIHVKPINQSTSVYRILDGISLCMQLTAVLYGSL